MATETIVVKCMILLILVGCCFSAMEPVYQISTFLGGGSTLTDGILATDAKLVSPRGIILTSNADLYVADSGSGRIIKVDANNNLVSIVAGSTSSGTSSTGNNGLATDATLHSPYGVAVNDVGEVYVAEYGSHVVRKILTNGTIVAFAGIVNSGNFNGDGGLAIDSKLNNPYGVLYNSFTGEVYIADSSNLRIRSVLPNNTIATIMGNGQGGLGTDGVLATASKIVSPANMALDSNGNLYVATTASASIRMVNSSNNIISTVAGSSVIGYDGDGGNALDAKMTLVHGVAIGPNREILISDTLNHVIRKISTKGIISTIAGRQTSSGFGGDSGLATDATISNPYGVVVDHSTGIVYFCDIDNSRVRKLTPYCTKGTLLNGICTYSCYGIDYDDERACGGHGKCSDSNLCVCDSGWGGDSQCSKPSCENLNNCTGHGLCVSNNTCSCDSGWTGNAECSQFTCGGIANCNNHGICISNNTCSCTSGWKGSLDCTQYSCELLNNCNGNGLCISNNTCQCNSGWRSQDCSQFTCSALNNCSSHGECISNNTCLCNSGWKGNSQCSLFSCEILNECNGKGNCISNNTCQCDIGWISNDCSQFSCSNLNSCSTHGDCISNNTCSCNSGWKGSLDCAQHSCENVNNCNGHGSCISNNTCSCISGWNGDSQCSKASCENLNNCNGNGLCVSNNTCQCNSGWKNQDCSQFTCSSLNNCSSHGACISNNTCSCISGWKGSLDCMQPSCELLNNCNGNGLCISNNTCQCNSKWKRADCSLRECVPSLDSNNQLSCSSVISQSSFTFSELQSNTFNSLKIDLNENQEINSQSGGSLSNITDLSNYFISSSFSASNSQFYSNITSLIIQHSNSTLIQTLLSNSVQYYFKNMKLEKTYNYTCLRFDYNSNRWTNESISTSIISQYNQITCSTNYISTSVVIFRREISIVIPVTNSPKVSKSIIGQNSKVSPKDSDRTTISSSFDIKPSLMLLICILLSWLF